MGKLKITHGSRGNTEITLDGKPISSRFLKSLKLDMHSEKGNVLTLHYHVKDVDIDIDDVEVDTEEQGYY